MTSKGAPPKTGKILGGNPSRRRFIFRGDGSRDRAVAEKLSSLHVAWTSLINTEQPFARVQVVLAVAYYIDMVSTDDPRSTVPILVFPQDVADATGLSESLAGAYLAEAARHGLLVGTANAGYRLP